MKTTVYISSKEIKIFVYITCSETKKHDVNFFHALTFERKTIMTLNLASAFVLTCTEPGQCRGEPVL